MKLICDGCIFYHPGRQEKKCSCLPRAVPEEMERCSVRIEAPSETALAMRVLSAEEMKRKTDGSKKKKKK